VTYAGRIRVYLIAVAVLPPLLVMFVIYFHSIRQVDSADRRQAYRNLQEYDAFARSREIDLDTSLKALTAAPSFEKAVMLVKSGRADRAVLDPRPFDLDFLEITDTALRVLATYHRPGLLGERIQVPGSARGPSADGERLNTVEYDIEGPHAANTIVKPIDDNLFVYTGQYLDQGYRRRLSEVLNAQIDILIEPDLSDIHIGMEPGVLYRVDDRYQAVLTRSPSPGFITVATFETGAEKPVFLSLLTVTGVVAVLSVAAAIALGMLITGRVKREIDNLVQASEQISKGDFSTPVIAYQEGEFSRVADSLNEMTARLNDTRKKLATSEKIAAWQTVGRKVAHEIKNPLTPIAISVDDLRRSYQERLPDFDRTLRQTTDTIKSEVDRLTKLLEQFVSFARMSAPVIRRVSGKELAEKIKSLYRPEIESGRLKWENRSQRKDLSLDPDAVTQVLVNLIKNGFESGDGATVQVRLEDEESDLVVTVEDSGPGFTNEKLQSSFEPYVSSKKGGSGLGLVICHRLVHDHGGTMELYNRTEGGGGVKIRLPQ